MAMPLARSSQEMPSMHLQDAHYARSESSPQEERGDPLWELAKDFPEKVADFLKVTVCIQLVGGFLSLATIPYMIMNWSDCGCCNRPLRLWAFIHCGLQLLQLPMRIQLFHDLSRLQHRRADVADLVRQLTESQLWKTNKLLAIAAYAWIILGIIWLLNSVPCAVRRICWTLLFITGIKLLATWLAFQAHFPRGQEELLENDEDADEAPRGAAWDVIDALPVLLCTSCVAEDGPESGCAICLSEFELGCSLRRLPCGHKFHQPCIDTWLSKRKVCPLCLQDIDILPVCDMSAQGKKRA